VVISVSTVDLFVHPVRLRVLQAFFGGRELATAGPAAELGDLPSGGLRCHVSLPAGGDVLKVVSERRVRTRRLITGAFLPLPTAQPGDRGSDD
jgi:hypothetical protein